jgi:hypothetical protein
MAERDLNFERFRRVDHCRVTFRSGFERGVGLGDIKGNDFAAPTELFGKSVWMDNKWEEQALHRQRPKS